LFKSAGRIMPLVILTCFSGIGFMSLLRALWYMYGLSGIGFMSLLWA
jgi:hypothetical protein